MIFLAVNENYSTDVDVVVVIVMLLKSSCGTLFFGGKEEEKKLMRFNSDRKFPCMENI